MHDEAEVGLVETHAEGTGRDEGLDLVAAQGVLELLAVGRVGAARVRTDLVTGLGEGSSRVLGRRDGEGVDDAAAGQVVEVGHEPPQPVAGTVEGQAA